MIKAGPARVGSPIRPQNQITNPPGRRIADLRGHPPTLRSRYCKVLAIRHPDKAESGSEVAEWGSGGHKEDGFGERSISQCKFIVAVGASAEVVPGDDS